MADNGAKIDLWFNHLVAATALFMPGFLCGKFVAGAGPLLFVGGAITGIGGLLWLLSATKIDKGSNHIVLHKGKDYDDIGPGPVSIGIAKWTRRVLDYDPKMRLVEKPIRIQAKDGTFINATMGYSWKPDTDDLAEYFAENQDKRVESFAIMLVTGWAKRASPREIFSGSPPSMAENRLPGVKAGGPFLSNLVPEGGEDMSRHVRDNTHLLQSIIDEVEDESRIEAIRASLKAAYPDRDHRIDRLCDQRKAELRRRGLRA